MPDFRVMGSGQTAAVRVSPCMNPFETSSRSPAMLRGVGGSPITASPDDGSSSLSSMSGAPRTIATTRKRKAPSAAASSSTTTTTTTSRGVASLSKEQLEKKRANDREAQRAIRERTKAQIESLERRIHELTAQQPYQELQEAIRQKDAILAENVEIKRRLTSVLHLIQPLVGAQGLTELATAAHGTFAFHQHQQHHDAQSQVMSVEPAHHSHSHQTSVTTSPPPFQRQWHDTSNTDGSRSWDPSLEALNKQRVEIQRGLELPESGERLSFNFLLDSQPNKNLPSPNAVPASTTTYPPLSIPASWDRLPKNVPPTCPLDGILLRFLHSRTRENELSHASPGPAYPSVSSLLNPASQSPNIDPLSQVMTDIISKFPVISSLPDQVAVLLIMFWFMRWCLHPTVENYERLPEWIRPRPMQLYEAHPAFIDYIPWPEIREKLVMDHTNYPFDIWFIPFTTGMTTNWPYEATDCLLSMGDREAEPIVNPVFERHILRLENWSLGPEFQKAFPHLAKFARIKEKKVI